jgi:hypothetical protein
MENIIPTSRKPAHLRITVKTFYKGQEIDGKKMQENPELKNNLPSTMYFQEKYLKALNRIESDQFEYLLTVTEKEITLKCLY